MYDIIHTLMHLYNIYIYIIAMCDLCVYIYILLCVTYAYLQYIYIKSICIYTGALAHHKSSTCSERYLEGPHKRRWA